MHAAQHTIHKDLKCSGVMLPMSAAVSRHCWPGRVTLSGGFSISSPSNHDFLALSTCSCRQRIHYEYSGGRLVQTMGYTHATDIKALVLPLHLPWPRFATGLAKVWSLALADELSGLSTLQWFWQAGFLGRLSEPCPHNTLSANWQKDTQAHPVYTHLAVSNNKHNYIEVHEPDYLLPLTIAFLTLSTLSCLCSVSMHACLALQRCHCWLLYFCLHS